MSEALRKAALQAHDALEQLRDLSPKQAAALFALRAALAEPEQPEPVAYQYRWTNPDNRPHVHPSELEWKPVELRYYKTIPEDAAQLERYTYDGKPTYEVRKLYADPPRREPLSDEQISSIWINNNRTLSGWDYGGEKVMYEDDFQDAVRAIEAALGQPQAVSASSHGIKGGNNAK